LHGAFITEAASQISACISAADNALDKGVSFVEGHELDAAQSARIPLGYVGHKEAAQLLSRIEWSDDKGR
jgi:hypothetical protein